MRSPRPDARTLSLAATVLVVAVTTPAFAAGLRILPQRLPEAFQRAADDNKSDEPRLRHQQRHGLRDDLRQSQREGLTPAVGFDSEYEAKAPRRMSPEERRQLRREINDASHKLYGER